MAAKSVARRQCEQCELKRPLTTYTSDRARVCNVCKSKTKAKNDRAKRLRETYGITTDEDDQLADVQGRTCAGCRGKRRYFLHVDHDHALERALLAKGVPPEVAARVSVRGKLCARCNKVLRDVRDNPDILLWLCGYLRNPPAHKVIKGRR